MSNVVLADPPPHLPARLFYLDALRGVAALAIVFWHWQHFFHRGTRAVAFDRTRLPGFEWFSPFYLEGWRAVDLFFVLSGFIFFLLYAQRVAAREVGGRNFSTLRFSRLYPLHLLTLLIVAVGQAVFHAQLGDFFVFPRNDAYHFLLNLGFVSGWGLAHGFSFNAPVWSVSVEVLLYAIFFVVCRAGWHRPLALIAFVLLGIGLREVGFQMIGRGVTCFFMGGLAVYAFHAIRARTPSVAILALGLVATTALWFVVPLSRLGHELVIFPATVLILALVEDRGAPSGRALAFLGDISYSTYLLHFPLQIAFVLAAVQLGLKPVAFFSPWSLVAFFGVLIPLAWCSYHGIERPLQRRLRSRFLRPET